MPAPNVLLIVIDCLRADFVYQPGLAHIPIMDALRRDGFAFLNAIASTSTTTPSFASLLSGRYPFENGVRSHSGYRLAPDIVLLPQLLKEAGYHTYAEVCGPLGPEVGLTSGFDEYAHRGRSEDVHGEWGEDLLRKLRSHYRQPWFLLLHVWSLHKKRVVLPECRNDACGRSDYARALSSIDVYLARLLAAVPQDSVIVLTGDHGETIARGRLDAFQKGVRKDFWRFLLKRKLTRRHISRLYRNCHVGHGYSLYDELVKVPVILRHPVRVPAGASEVQVRHVDVAPTLLALVGAAGSEGMTGQSLLPIIRGEDSTHRDAYMEAVGVVMPDKDQWLAGLRVDNRYKLICAPFRPDLEPELYDLVADPGEGRNAIREHPAVAADLRSRIDALQAHAMRGVAFTEAEREAVAERLRDLGYLDH